MRSGLIPPLAGDYHNDWKHSNGAWIRTEVWACMAPGCPDVAAKYAIEDAKVDHGTGEGTFAAAFVAAMQSAAFVVRDLRKCIEIGLSEIPEDCRMADSIRLVLDCYDSGKTARETRDAVLARNADIGDGWFEAPSNVAYAIQGLLYGAGDFKRTMIEAINCGDDTDCTAATVGATMGILYGMGGIPEDWRAHIGDDIVTISVDRGGVCRKIPGTCTELTDRVVAQTPHVLFANDAYVALTEGAEVIPADVEELVCKNCKLVNTLKATAPYSTHFDFTFASVDVVLDDAPEIEPMGARQVTVTVRNNKEILENMLYNLELRWWLPEGFTVESGRQTAILPRRDRRYDGTCTLTYTIRAGETVAPNNRCVLEIAAQGRITPMYIPVVLLG